MYILLELKVILRVNRTYRCIGLETVRVGLFLNTPFSHLLNIFFKFSQLLTNYSMELLVVLGINFYYSLSSCIKSVRHIKQVFS